MLTINMRTSTIAAVTAMTALGLINAQDAVAPAPTTTEDPWLASGCSMARDTALMLCLGDYASVPPAAPSGLSEADQAAYYCDMYSQLADCWAAGLYCKEWYPMQVAADKFCALANTTSMDGLDLPSQTTTLPPSSTAIAGIGIGGAGIAELLPTAGPAVSGDSSAVNTLSSVLAEASNVITSIWNNDSGTDIPAISNDLASETIPTWTHMSESTPLPATDPVGTSAVTTTTAAEITPPPTKMRRKVVFE